MMTRKKKKINLNVFDRYLQQKRYSNGKNVDEMGQLKKVVKIVVPRIDEVQFLYSSLTYNERNVRRSSRKSNCYTLGEKNMLIKHLVWEKGTENQKSKKNATFNKTKKKISLTSAVKPEIQARKIQSKSTQNKKIENKRNHCLRTQSKIRKNKKNKITKFNSTNQYTSNNIKNASQFAKTTSGIKCSDRNHHEDLIGRREAELVEEERLHISNSFFADEPFDGYISSASEGQNSDTQSVEKIIPLTKKYQPYMEKLKSLTSDAIKKFIIDNQQYYVDFKREIESKFKTLSSSNKKWKKYDEMKESFKCNPFNSNQQLAMYYTLRDIFKVPKTHFKECRNFFTVLIPEISCQLFAETFRIKVSFAPRLIKKLYPKPVCAI